MTQTQNVMLGSLEKEVFNSLRLVLASDYIKKSDLSCKDTYTQLVEMYLNTINRYIDLQGEIIGMDPDDVSMSLVCIHRLLAEQYEQGAPAPIVVELFNKNPNLDTMDKLVAFVKLYMGNFIAVETEIEKSIKKETAKREPVKNTKPTKQLVVNKPKEVINISIVEDDIEANKVIDQVMDETITNIAKVAEKKVMESNPKVVESKPVGYIQPFKPTYNGINPSLAEEFRKIDEQYARRLP